MSYGSQNYVFEISGKPLISKFFYHIKITWNTILQLVPTPYDTKTLAITAGAPLYHQLLTLVLNVFAA